MEHEMELEVFRAGDYGRRGKYDEAMLEQMAGDYARERHEAPVTVDHHQDGPARGWVRGLRRVGDTLIARIGGLAPEFLEQVKTGKFKKRSVELYRAFHDTGRPYLKALTFLGAAAPVVKGLADPVFGESEDSARIAFAETSAAEPERGEAAEHVPAHVTNEIEAFCEQLEKGGRLSPALRGKGLAEFLASLDGETPRPFGENGTALTQREWMRDFLQSRCPAVPFGESAPEREEASASGLTLAPGRNVAPESVAMHERVCHYRRSHPEASYAEALGEVSRVF